MKALLAALIVLLAGCETYYYAKPVQGIDQEGTERQLYQVGETPVVRVHGGKFDNHNVRVELHYGQRVMRSIPNTKLTPGHAVTWPLSGLPRGQFDVVIYRDDVEAGRFRLTVVD